MSDVCTMLFLSWKPSHFLKIISLQEYKLSGLLLTLWLSLWFLSLTCVPSLQVTLLFWNPAVSSFPAFTKASSLEWGPPDVYSGHTCASYCICVSAHLHFLPCPPAMNNTDDGDVLELSLVFQPLSESKVYCQEQFILSHIQSSQSVLKNFINEWLSTGFRLARVFPMAFKDPNDWISDLFFSFFSVLCQLTEHSEVQSSCYSLPHEHPASTVRWSASSTVCFPLSSPLPSPDQGLRILSSSVPGLLLEDYLHWSSASPQALIVKCYHRTLGPLICETVLHILRGHRLCQSYYKNFSKFCEQYVWSIIFIKW